MSDISQHHSESLVDQVHMLGGEMLTWSDEASTRGHFPGALAFELAADLPGARGRVLVLGPHSESLVRGLADSAASVDVLLRSWPDAQLLRREVKAPNLTVYCGPVASFLQGRERDYDCVMALDGFGRLHTVDFPALGWGETLEAVHGLLADDGDLVMTVSNSLGIYDMLGMFSDPAADDALWPQGVAVSSPPPAGHDRMLAAIDSTGLRISSTLSGFPTSSTPTLLVSDDALATLHTDDRILTLVWRSFSGLLDSVDMLKDPRELGVDAVSQGLGSALASCWVVTAHRGPGAHASAPDRPTVMFAESSTDEFWSTGYAVDRTEDGGLTRRLLKTEQAEGERTVGVLSREVSALEGKLPRGETLEESLMGVLAAHNLPAARELLQRYVSCLSEHAVTQPWHSPWSHQDEGPRRVLDHAWVMASLDNVLIHDESLELFDSSWRVELDVPLEVVLLHNLRRFAQRLLHSGRPHPWPAGSTLDQIARSLAASVSIPVNEALRHQASALAGEVGGPPSAWVRLDPAQSRDAEAEKARHPLGHIAVMAHAEALAMVSRLTDELAETQAQVEWLIRHIHRKERALRRARGRLRAVRESRTYRVGARLKQAKDMITPGRGLSDDEEADKHEWRPPSEDRDDALDPKLLPPGYQPDPVKQVLLSVEPEESADAEVTQGGTAR